MPEFDATSLTLLGRVQADQKEAWDRLVELYGPLVHYWCRRSGLTKEDADDLFQEVFRSVSQHIHDFRKEQAGDTFRGWLRTITMNKIRDHARRMDGKALAQGGSIARQILDNTPDPVLDADQEDSQEASLMQKSLQKALEWIRDDFAENTWQAFWRCQMLEQPTDLIASDLEMSTAAVRKAKYRVLRRLREELDGLIE